MHSKCWISIEIISNYLFFLFTYFVDVMSNCLLCFGVSNIYCLIRTVWVCSLNSQQVDINLYHRLQLWLRFIWLLKQTILTSHDPKQYFGWFSSSKKVFLNSWMSHSTVYLTQIFLAHHDLELFWHLLFLSSIFGWFSSPKKNLPGVMNESF